MTGDMKRFAIFLALVGLVFSAAAQKNRWSFHVGYNNAVGSFARVDIPNNDWIFISNTSIKGGAGCGFDVGFAYRLPLGGSERYGLIFSADMLWTELSKAVRQNMTIEANNARSNFENVSVAFPRFINVPILGGFHYEFGIGKNANMFVEPQIGASFRHITDRSAEFVGATVPVVENGVSMYEYVYRDNYYNSLSFAFRLTVGFVFKEHWMVDASYLYTGRQIVEGYEDYRFSTNQDLSSPVSGSASFVGGHTTPMFVTVRFGYRL